MPHPMWDDPSTHKPSKLWCGYTGCGNRAEMPWDRTEPDVRLCFKHLRQAVDLSRTAGELYRVLFGEHFFVPRRDRPPLPPEVWPEGSVVYYIAFGDRIKIGTSTNLQKRLAALPYDEVLAIERGDRLKESVRHSQFSSFRVTGEWFERSPELLAHIDVLNGAPMTDAPRLHRTSLIP